MTIVHIPDDIKQEFKINSDGSTSVSIKAAARIVGVTAKALRENLKKGVGDFSTSKMAQKLVKAGFEGGDFSEFSKTGIPDIALGVILEYYAFDAEENCTNQAKSIYRSFATITLRNWIKAELGVATAQASLEKLTQNQLLRLKCAAGCSRDFGDDLDENFLSDIDPVFWNMPLEVCEYLFYKAEQAEAKLWVDWFLRHQAPQDSFGRKVRGFAAMCEKLAKEEETAKQKVSTLESRALPYLNTIVELKKAKQHPTLAGE